MNEIYWITRLDSIKCLIAIVLVFSTIALAIGFALYVSKKGLYVQDAEGRF